ncbi:succinate dehydrogenase cytochrome b subunit [Spongisporangium articulatum]|uniref:Succinate dehydrogenase cytochrome b subunit n=1 Tax=Spongisporangium articulatum TaxID=3362603 RepID=A0ABW8ASN1_9ACTN
MTAKTAPASKRATSLSTLHRSAVGKKMIMAVTGLLMLAFVIVHMLGNLKFYEGQEGFDHYAAWLRTIGEPLLLHGMYLWIQRAVLLVALVAHVWSAASLTKQDVQARPVGYTARRKGGYAASTMRWGGVILLLFVIYHLLDLSAAKLNPAPAGADVYERMTADFSTWYVTLAYTVAMLALCLHIAHGLWSAATTLGVGPATTASYRTVAVTVAVLITVGFLVVPFSVAFGLVD